MNTKQSVLEHARAERAEASHIFVALSRHNAPKAVRDRACANLDAWDAKIESLLEGPCADPEYVDLCNRLEQSESTQRLLFGK